MRLLSFGEIVWDQIGADRVIGGAPLNVAGHTVRMGHTADIVSAIGQDELGNASLAAVRELGVGDGYIRRTHAPTCLVTAELDADGIPTFTIPAPTSFDQISVDPEDLQRMTGATYDWLCFGTLAQRSEASREALASVLAARPAARVFCDVNLRMRFYSKAVLSESLGQADVVKMNDGEAHEIGEMMGVWSSSLRDLSRRLAGLCSGGVLCITRGELGAVVVWPGGFAEHPGYSVRVVDTVGSGDAFSAAFLVSLASGSSPGDALDLACRAGAITASHRGALPSDNVSALSDLA